jgi:energy-coupling factor transport system ATP-binding protein
MDETTTNALVKIENLSYRPMGADHDILKDVNLQIEKGDFILLLGPSGCGKSMLTRCMNGLIPHLDEGELQGVVRVQGKDTRAHKIHEFSTVIGMVFQNPDDQIVSLIVVDEVAWGVENQGLPRDVIIQRVERALEQLGISDIKDRLTFAISGGQKQKVSIASNLAMQQVMLILDDPTTDLDPICKAEVVQALAKLHHEIGLSILVIEHDLNDLIELANRIVLMEDGHVILEGSPCEMLTHHYDKLTELGVNIPQHVEIAHFILNRLGSQAECPPDKQGAFELLRQYVEKFPPLPAKEEKYSPPLGETIIKVEHMDFSYSSRAQILHDLNFEVKKGEFLAIVGANGSGKSTLVNNFTGLLKPDKGQVLINGHDTKKMKMSDLIRDLGYVFQNPDHQLFANSVFDEVAFSLRLRKVPEDEVAKRVEETLQFVDLWNIRDRHPSSLSRGQRQKLAVATALIHKPGVILLDEPTTGQDSLSLDSLMTLMVNLNREGNTTIMVTHDMDIVAAYATRVMVMSAGRFVFDGRLEDVFYDQYETLSKMNLKPPTVVDFCRRLADKGVPRCLNVNELFQYLDQVAGKEVDINLMTA